MKITVTGSLGNISKRLTEILVAAGHDVTVVSSDPGKAALIEALGAKPAIGSIEDVSFLKTAFSGADAVYTMVPPIFQTNDWKKSIADYGANYATAIKETGIRYVVNLSSIGAHLAEGAGPVSGIHRVENLMNKLENVNIIHLRPGYFYTNLYNSVGMIRQAGILGSNNGANDLMVMADPSDIAKVAAKHLLDLSFSGKSFEYIASDVRTNAEVAAVIGNAIGKPGLPWVEFTDEDTKQAMMQNGLPEELAKNFVEMGAGIRSGIFFEDFNEKGNGVKLEEFASEFAKSF